MSDIKTQPTTASVEQFLSAITDQQKREDCFVILKLMQETTGETPQMWGDSIVGFGSYHYKGASGREGDWFITGFSPRKQNLTLYIISGFEQFGHLLKSLGKHTISKSCLYVKRLSDVDMPTLRTLISQSVAHMKRSYPPE